MCDIINFLLVYGSLKYIYISLNMQQLAIYMRFDDHFQAHCVKKTSNIILIQFNDIPYIKPVFVYTKNNSCFIP